MIFMTILDIDFGVITNEKIRLQIEGGFTSFDALNELEEGAWSVEINDDTGAIEVWSDKMTEDYQIDLESVFITDSYMKFPRDLPSTFDKITVDRSRVNVDKIPIGRVDEDGFVFSHKDYVPSRKRMTCEFSSSHPEAFDMIKCKSI